MKSYKKIQKIFEEYIINEFFNKKETDIYMFYENELYFSKNETIYKIGKNKYGIIYLGFPVNDRWYYQVLAGRYPNIERIFLNKLNGHK